MLKKIGLTVAGVSILSTTILISEHVSGKNAPEPSPVILQTAKEELIEGKHYIPSSIKNIQWGSLPNKNSKPIETISSGDTVTFDTVSHEGLLEDQGRDPVKFFGKFGVEKDEVLDDAIAIADSDIEHDFDTHGPHIVTGPIAIEGAEPGDVLKVEILSLTPRVPYGVISNRHYKGALPGEFPENEGRKEGASAEHPELYNNVSTFTPVERINDRLYGVLPVEGGEDVRFPLKPFMGLMGVAPNTNEKVSSIPPIETGGNIDINELGVGSTLYLPIQVKEGLFFTGDPHFAQGDGEVSLTAWEASLRATFRLTVLKSDNPSIPRNGEFKQPFAETEDYWIPIGLDEDLDEAMKESVRESIGFLNEKLGMDRATAFAYLSAATDYEVSQVVDRTKGIHALINKKHFIDNLQLSVSADGEKIDSVIKQDDFYVSLEELVKHTEGKAKIKANKKGNKVTVTMGDQTIRLENNSNIYEVNGKSIYHEGAPALHKGQLFIPIKAIPDIVGAKVNWTTSGTQLEANITINTKK